MNPHSFQPQSEEPHPTSHGFHPHSGESSHDASGFSPGETVPIHNLGAPTQPPIPPASQLSIADSTRPIPVVRVLSPVGVEYVFLTLTLIAGAIALASALIAVVNDKTDYSVLAFPAAVLLVTVPVFAIIFLHLKKIETDLPEMRLDPSKRRSTQITQIVAFVACLFTLIGFVYDVFSKLGGQGGPTIMKAGLDASCILVVAGGILYYYWRDEHKRVR